MKMPGFTAENSISSSAKSYYVGEALGGTTHHRIDFTSMIKQGRDIKLKKGVTYVTFQSGRDWLGSPDIVFEDCTEVCRTVQLETPCGSTPEGEIWCATGETMKECWTECFPM